MKAFTPFASSRQLASLLNTRSAAPAAPRPALGNAIALAIQSGARRAPPAQRDEFFTKVDDGAAMEKHLPRYQAEMSRYRELMEAQTDASSFAPARDEEVRFHAPEVKAQWDAIGVAPGEEGGEVESAEGGEDFGKTLSTAAESALKGVADALAGPFKALGKLFGF